MRSQQGKNDNAASAKETRTATRGGARPGKRSVDGDTARRRALTALGLGAIAFGATSAPTRWVKPIVDSVVMPVHAQVTPRADPMGPGAGGGPSDPVNTDCPVVPGTREFTADGSFTVPDCVTEITVVVVGATGGGGGGGGTARDGGNPRPGDRASDGAAGETLQETVAVSEGESLTIMVGQGGGGGTAGTDTPTPDGQLGVAGVGGSGGSGADTGGVGANGVDGEAGEFGLFINSHGGSGGGGGGGGSTAVMRGSLVLVVAKGGDGGLGGASSGSLIGVGGLGGRGGDGGTGGGGGGTGGFGSSGGTSTDGAPGSPGSVRISWS